MRIYKPATAASWKAYIAVWACRGRRWEVAGVPFDAGLGAALAAAEALGNTERNNILPMGAYTPGCEADSLLDLQENLKHLVRPAPNVSNCRCKGVPPRSKNGVSSCRMK